MASWLWGAALIVIVLEVVSAASPIQARLGAAAEAASLFGDNIEVDFAAALDPKVAKRMRAQKERSEQIVQSLGRAAFDIPPRRRVNSKQPPKPSVCQMEGQTTLDAALVPVDFPTALSVAAPPVSCNDVGASVRVVPLFPF